MPSTWDALLGVLGVWHRHAQADDYMPVMAWVIVHLTRNRAEDLTVPRHLCLPPPLPFPFISSSRPLFFFSLRGTPIYARSSKYSGKDYTCITFKPDLARFKMDCLDDDAVGLLCKRVYDIAGCCNSYSGARLQVHLNGKKLPVKSFQQYVSFVLATPWSAWPKACGVLTNAASRAVCR